MDLPTFTTKALGFFTKAEKQLDTLSQAHSDLEVARTRITQLEGEAAGIRQSVTDLTAKLATANTELAATKTQLTEATGKVTELTTKNTELQGKIEDPKGEIQRQAAAKASQIALSQGVSPLKEGPAPANPQNPKPATQELKGRARLEAGIRAEFSTRK